MAGEILTANDIGRLTALSGSAAATDDKIPIYDTSTKTLRYATPDQIASGASAVDGPASATDNAIARFDGTTGKIIQNSAATIADTTGAISIAGTSNQFVLGTTTTTTISATAPASSAVYTIPDVGTTGNFILSAGTQSITGTKTFTNSALKLLGSSTGATTFTSDNAGATNYTLHTPAADSTLAAIGVAQTWTAIQTFTNSDVKLLGSSTGANTFTALNSSATNYTTSVPAVTGVLATTTGANLFYADITRCSSALTKNANTTYANITGLSQTVVPGTYMFVCRLPSTVANGTGGIKYAFNYTTTALTSIEATSRGMTATAIATQHTTTTTTQTDLFTQAAVVLYTEIVGSMVVSTGGTIDLQMAQNTSDGSNTVALVGGTMQFVRIA